MYGVDTWHQIVVSVLDAHDGMVNNMADTDVCSFVTELKHKTLLSSGRVGRRPERYVFCRTFASCRNRELDD
jgi:hypothetical protein